MVLSGIVQLEQISPDRIEMYADVVPSTCIQCSKSFWLLTRVLQWLLLIAQLQIHLPVICVVIELLHHILLALAIQSTERNNLKDRCVVLYADLKNITEFTNHCISTPMVFLLTGDILLKGLIMLYFRDLFPKDIFIQMFYCTLVSGGNYSYSEIIIA